MPLIRRGSNFFSLQHFIALDLDLMACLPYRQRREAIKALNPRKEQSIAARNYLREKHFFIVALVGFKGRIRLEVDRIVFLVFGT